MGTSGYQAWIHDVLGTGGPWEPHDVDDRVRAAHDEAVRRGDDQYLDPRTGYPVFTSDFLVRRGTCCGSGCRHCPYGAPD
jgi:hypothetical protein